MNYKHYHYCCCSDKENCPYDSQYRIVRIIELKTNKKEGRDFDDMLRRVPSLERINEAIGYEPKATLDNTLDLIIESFRS